VLESLLRQQCYVLSRKQAIAVGITPSKIRANVRAGRRQRLLPHVYATFTGPAPRNALLWAVVLRAGEGAVLSHETAAELNGLLDQPMSPIHVTVPTDRKVRPIPGVIVHRSGRAALATHPGPDLPRTRVEETVVDLTQSANSLRGCPLRRLRHGPRTRWPDDPPGGTPPPGSAPGQRSGGQWDTGAAVRLAGRQSALRHGVADRSRATCRRLARPPKTLSTGGLRNPDDESPPIRWSRAGAARRRWFG
jgi:hypothetical protein